MPSIRQAKSGRWQAIVRRKNFPDQSDTFRLKAEAEAWARDIENKMDRGIFIDRREAETTTLKNALDRYEREVTVKKKGAAQEKYRINDLRNSILGDYTLATLRSTEVAAYRDAELARNLAGSTVMKSLALLSHLFEVARKEWHIEADNPVKSIAKPKINNARDRRLAPEEWTYLQAALDEPGDSVKTISGDRRNEQTPKIVRWAVETAMRQGEILALDWQYIDLVKRTAHLPATKNGKSRDVPLSLTAIGLITDLTPKKGPVFPTTATALKQSWSRAVARGRRMYLADCKANMKEPEDAFLVDMTFHDLRHEGVTRLAERLQMHQLMKVTGHKDARMLARYYHPRAEDLAKLLT